MPTRADVKPPMSAETVSPKAATRKPEKGNRPLRENTVSRNGRGARRFF